HPALRAPTRTPKSTLSLHDALPICRNAETDGRRGGLSSGRRDRRDRPGPSGRAQRQARLRATAAPRLKRLAGLDMTRLLFAVSADRKSTRRNSSHAKISYAVVGVKE